MLSSEVRHAGTVQRSPLLSREPLLAQKRSQKFKVMKFENSEREVGGRFLGGKTSCQFRGKRTSAIAMKTVSSEPKFRTEIPFFLEKNSPNSEERGIYTNPS